MTEGKNSKSDSQEEQPKLDKEQYKFLKECSKKGPEGINEWNKWRKENRSEQIWLQGVKLWKANLQGANLFGANLQGSYLGNTNLQGAYLGNANLQGANLRWANLQGANLGGANLQGADLPWAKLEEAKLSYANLQGAELRDANLQGAELYNANLQGAIIFRADLQGARLNGANLQRAKLIGVIVNGSTNFLYCKIDKDTDFRDVGLENMRIESGTKTLLKYNIRRMNWRDWYAKHRFWQWPVKLFWSLSNYGISTLRIVAWFFFLALFFAAIYSNCAYWQPPGVVDNLEVEAHLPLWHYSLLVLLRPVYFSIVTMTTLGFGDMFAHDESVLGHLLLTIQVILGYVLLGAMVTRLAVLFTSDGPAGSYTPMDEKTKELLSKPKKDKGN